EGGVREWEVREYDDGAVRLRFPVLEPVQIQRLAGRLRTARAGYLAGVPVAEVVRAIDETAALLQDPGHPNRKLAEMALPAITGYSPPMIRLILDRMLANWRAPALEELLQRELGEPAVLDGFHALPGSSVRPGALPVRVRAY